jgi:hypothetical protein
MSEAKPNTFSNPVIQTFGGPKAEAFEYECGLVFCRQPMEVAGETRKVVAVWKPNQTNNSPVYAMVIDKFRCFESMIGCAVLALETVGITRPRLGSIQRVAGVFAKLSA